MKTETLFFSLTFLVCFGLQAQNVITIDNSIGANAQYDNISDAIAAATDGDILYVHASETTYGAIIIDRPLSLIGYSHSSEDKRTKISRVQINVGISGVSIRGVHLTDTGNFCLNILGSGSTPLEDFVLENNKIDGLIQFQGVGANNVIIRGNILDRIGTFTTVNTNYTNTIITNNIFRGFLNVNFYNSVEVKNNIFLASRPRNVNTEGDLNVQDCIIYNDSGSNYNPNSDSVVYQNCLSYNPTSTLTALDGTNNIDDQNPLFITDTGNNFDAQLSDYSLQAGSPAIGAGISGNDVGLFTGVVDNFIFNNFGFSQGIPTVAITAITNTVAPGGTVNVTIESNSN